MAHHFANTAVIMSANKKPYIFKKYDAMSKSDPVACFHAENDERILSDLMDELAVGSKKMQDRTGESGVGTKHEYDRKKFPY